MEQKRQVLITDLLPANFDDLVHKQLKKHINEIDVTINRKGGAWALKSTPIVRLARQELLNADYIFDEYKRVLDKTSKHPSAVRQAIADLNEFAFAKALQEAFKDQRDNDGMPPIPEDILDDLAKREAEKLKAKKYGQQETDENGTEQKTE